MALLCAKGKCGRKRVARCATLLVFSFRYTPKMINIEHKLLPFIPDFIPAVGDIDAFLKVWYFQVPPATPAETQGNGLCSQELSHIVLAAARDPRAALQDRLL